MILASCGSREAQKPAAADAAPVAAPAPPDAAPAPRPGGPLACAPGCDLAKAEGVAAAYEKAVGKPLERGYGSECIARPAGLPKAVAVGHFAHDLGCVVDGAFAGCCWGKVADDAAPLLAELGWAAAAPEERARLALAFTTDVLFAFETVTRTPTEDFGKGKNPPFEAPASQPLPDGGVAVTLWTEARSGARRAAGPRYERWRLRFAADGTLGERVKEKEFTGKW